MRFNVGSDFADEYIRAAFSVVGEKSPSRSKPLNERNRLVSTLSVASLQAAFSTKTTTPSTARQLRVPLNSRELGPRHVALR
jgi:hypothetical protein